MTAPTPGVVARLRELEAAATEAPWGWRGNIDGPIELRSLTSMQPRVVTAMRSEPCVVELDDNDWRLTAYACASCTTAWIDGSEGVTCDKGANLNTLWLLNQEAHVIQPANEWAVREVHYRGDVVAVDHPDAALIAEARNALPALLAVAEAAAAYLSDDVLAEDLVPTLDALRDALAAMNDPTREDTDRG